MKVTFQISAIKEFLSRTKHIKPNPFMDITNSILFEVGLGMAVLYKNNLTTFCSHEISNSGIGEGIFSVLITERILQAICESNSSDELAITCEDRNAPEGGLAKGKVRYATIESGSSKVTTQTDNYEDFPQFPEYDKESTVTLDKDFLQAISVAKKFTSQAVITQDSFVYVNTKGTKTEVYASKGSTMYVKAFDCAIPAFQLGLEACNLVGNYESLTFFQTSNHMFFDTGNTVYGFVKNDHAVRDYSRFITTKGTGQEFLIKKADMLKYLELCGTINNSKIEVPVTLEQVDGGIGLLLNDQYYNIDNETVLAADIGKIEIEPTSISHRNMANLLSSLPYETIKLEKAQGYFLVKSEDPAYVGCISILNYQSN